MEQHVKQTLAYEQNEERPGQRKKFIRDLFDDIVPTYDLLNRVLSCGIDRGWRKSLVKMGGDLRGRSVLDLCCGTGDQSRALRRAGATTVSLDFSLNMLKKGRERGWLNHLSVAADASELPFKNNSFDLMTVAFGIRNIPDLDRFISEARRVLVPGGRLLVLELTRPVNRPAAFFYRIYLERLIPFVGGIISGKGFAYRYLSGTISSFPGPEGLSEMFLSQGWSDVSIHRKTMGVATILECSR